MKETLNYDAYLEKKERQKKTTSKMFMWVIVLMLMLAGIIYGAYVIGGNPGLRASILIAVAGFVIAIIMENAKLLKK